MLIGKYIRTDEIRNKNRLASLGIKKSEATKEKLRLRKPYIRTSEIKNKNRLSRLGKTWSLEVRERMSLSHIGQVAWNRGKHIPSPCSFKSGNLHPNWKGGITSANQKVRSSLQYKLWRKAVLERDDFTCQLCNKKEINLHAHHIKGFAQAPELRFAIDNGMTLCKECHKLTPNYKGKGNKKCL